jgi:DNA-binding NarL/FixJ family response regulator
MRILIADDNFRLREGIRSMLSEANHEVCGEAADTDETVRLASELRPDLILLDISMPGAGGLEAARQIRHVLPDTKILVMSHHDPVHISGPAIEAGAQGCIDKGRLGPDLLREIERI